MSPKVEHEGERRATAEMILRTDQKVQQMHKVIVGDGETPGLAEVVRGHGKMLQAHEETKEDVQKALFGNGDDGLVHKMRDVLELIARRRSGWEWFARIIIAATVGLAVFHLR